MSLDIEALEALAKTATQGIWNVEKEVANSHIFSDVIFDEQQDGVAFTNEPNSSFIAAASPMAVLELISEIKSLRDENTTLKAQFDKLRQMAAQAIDYIGKCYEHAAKKENP